MLVDIHSKSDRCWWQRLPLYHLFWPSDIGVHIPLWQWSGHFWSWLQTIHSWINCHVWNSHTFVRDSQLQPRYQKPLYRPSFRYNTDFLDFSLDVRVVRHAARWSCLLARCVCPHYSASDAQSLRRLHILDDLPRAIHWCKHKSYDLWFCLSHLQNLLRRL